MFTYVELILAALKIINAIMGAINQDKWMQAGRDEEIAKTAQAILAKTQAGKAILEKVNAMSDAEVDDALRGLEPR